MKKKLLVLLMAVISCVALAFGLTACDSDDVQIGDGTTTQDPSGGGQGGSTTAHTHTMTHYRRVEAGCTTAGNVEYWSCSGCGKYFSDESGKNVLTSTVLNATGHSFSTQWTSDATYHWHAATCEHTTETKDKAEHTYSNGVCSVCKSEEMTAGLSFAKFRTGYAVTGYNGTATEVIVPSTYNGSPVLSIGQGLGDGFQYCANVTEIVLPNTIQQIQSDAFAYCAKLKKITISACLAVGNNAFANCAALQEIAFPEGCLTYGDSLFENCSALKKVTIKSGVIGDKVFNGCTSVTDLELGSGVTSVSKELFTACTNLTNLHLANVTCLNFKLSELGKGSLKKVTITEQQLSLNDEKIKGAPCAVEVLNRFPINQLEVIGDSERFVDEFILSDYKLKVSRTSGEEEIFTLDESYLSSADLEKLKNKGTYSFTVNYDGFSTQWSITIKNHTFDQAVLQSQSFFYDGKQKSLQVTGAPEGTEITYSGNGKTEVGEYTVQATLSKQYYDTKTLTATLSVKKTDYEITYVTGLDGVKNPNATTYNVYQGLTLSAPERGGWEFLGWYQEPTFDTRVTSIKVNDSGDKTFYAKWQTIFTLSGGTITGLTNYGKTCTDIIIDPIIDGVKITEIGEEAFYVSDSSKRKLTNVTIGNGITEIGERAFSCCDKLTSVTIGSSVTSIGASAFKDCNGLKEVHISDLAAWCKISGLDSLMSSARTLYLNGEELKGDLVIPDGVTSIGDNAFYYCKGLTSVTIGNSVTSIGNYAFSGCSGLTSLMIPDSVTSIEEYAFYYCSGLTRVTIGNGVTSIGNSAFKNCSKLTSVTIPDSVTSIGELAFRECSSLTNITIPDSVTSIGKGAFQHCSGLTSVTIPESVTAIGDSAFYNCSGLTSVTIPVSVTSIGSSAFWGCSGLTNVTIPDSVTSIGESAFEDCSGLTSVTIPDSVTSIGSYAFSGCSGLTSVTIPDSVTSIGYQAFNGCSGLTSVTIPDSVTLIGAFAFNGCSGLTNVTIGDSVTSIGSLAFSGCSELTSVTIPDSVTSIEYQAFMGCSGLTSVTIGNSVTSIGESAFQGCSGLTSVTIPESVTSIGSLAFSGCSGLTSVTIPDGVTSIGYQAFSGCSGLTSVTIPDSVTSIGNYAFFGCTALTEIKFNAANCNGLDRYEAFSNAGKAGEGIRVVIGKNVTEVPAYLFYSGTKIISVEFEADSICTSIGSLAFSGCSELISVTIPDSVTSIGGSAFSDCSGLTSVTIGNSVTSIGDWAFYDCHCLVEVYNKASINITAGSHIYGYVAYYAANVYTVEGGSKLTTDGNGFIIYNGNRLVNYIGNESNITTPDSVTSIRGYAFYYCSGLTSVTIGGSVTWIGNYAFSGCSELTSVTIPDSVTEIGNSAFSACSKLTQIHYQGTKAQWNAITKRSNWNYNTGSYTVHCSDGYI